MNLLYCGNEKVYDGMMISLLSIIRHTKKELQIFVITLDLHEKNPSYLPISKQQTDNLQTMIQEVNPNSRIIRCDITEMFKKDMKDSPNIGSSYTPYTLLRLYADLIEEIPDRILYLDTDTIAADSIEPLFDTDLTQYEMAGVIDYLGKWFIDIHYMNAGVLYLNMEMIRRTGLFEKARNLCITKKMWFPDQSALNRLAEKKLFISTQYNEQRRLRKNTVIQHFCKSIRWFPFFHTVNIKPWEIEKMHSIYKLTAYDSILEEYRRRKA